MQVDRNYFLTFVLLHEAGHIHAGTAAAACNDGEISKLNVNPAWQKVKKNPLTFADGTSPNDTNAWQLAGSYDFKVVKLFAHVGEIRNNGTQTARLDVAYRIWDLSAAVPVGGSGSVLAGYAHRKTGDAVGPVPASASGGNVERKVFSLAYDYYLSKRTDLYMAYARDRTVTDTLPAPRRLLSASGHTVALGVRHRF